jgi:aromatic-L-amino-acid/L-tryptophan decarboxylase
MDPVNLRSHLDTIADHWRPDVVARLNGQEVKLVKFKGEFVWHLHEDVDELFLCLEGSFRIEFRDRTVHLCAGDCFVVPRGVEHRPVADDEVSVLLFEPAGVRNTGNVEHAMLTAPAAVPAPPPYVAGAEPAGQPDVLGSPSDPASLELTPDEMRRLGRDALERIISHIRGLPDAPVRGDVAAEDLCLALREPAPETGQAIEALLQPLFDEWLPRSFATPSPGYLAYIPGGGLYPAAVADFISGATNRYTGVWMAAPALVQLEANVLDWFRDWMGFPDTARGLLTTGGSMAAFNAVLCARERHLGRDIRAGVLYASTHAHHSIEKAARLAGVFEDRVRLIPVDGQFRLRADALAGAVRADRAAGLRPFMVVSSAGTTNTGAVDPLESIADVCEAEGMWHHVDGAYGAFFHMCETLRPLLAGLPRADSLTLDPHKGMFMPYGTGALLVRDGSALRAVHGMSAGYLPGTPDPETFYDPSQYGPELSRPFPGLRIWLCVKLFGATRFRAALAEKRALAVQAADRVAAIPGIVMVAPPQLSLFAFHVTWSGATLGEENGATSALLEGVTRRGRVMITGCTVDGRVLARVCVLSFRTRQAQIDACVEDIAAEVAGLPRASAAR